MAMNNQPDFSKRPRRKPDYQLELIDGELLLFHPSKSKIIYCNATASLVWRLCDGERTSREIAGLLGAAYPDQDETIEADVNAALATFAKNGVIEFG